MLTIQLKSLFSRTDRLYPRHCTGPNPGTIDDLAVLYAESILEEEKGEYKDMIISGDLGWSLEWIYIEVLFSTVGLNIKPGDTWPQPHFID